MGSIVIVSFVLVVAAVVAAVVVVRSALRAGRVLKDEIARFDEG